MEREDDPDQGDGRGSLAVPEHDESGSDDPGQGEDGPEGPEYDGGRLDAPKHRQEAALRRLRFVGRMLDSAVRVPGTNFRVGLDPVLGLVPGGGDAVAGALSLYIVAEAAYLGVPTPTVVRMLANVGVDVAVGSIPLIGDVFDAVWKANERNVALLEGHLDVDLDAAGETAGH